MISPAIVYDLYKNLVKHLASSICVNLNWFQKSEKPLEKSKTFGTVLPEICNYVRLPKGRLKVSWQSVWNSSKLGKFCYSIIPKISMIPWYHHKEIIVRGIKVNTKFVNFLQIFVSFFYTLGTHWVVYGCVKDG